jgi:hypothetical protein
MSPSFILVEIAKDLFNEIHLTLPNPTKPNHIHYVLLKLIHYLFQEVLSVINQWLPWPAYLSTKELQPPGKLNLYKKNVM